MLSIKSAQHRPGSYHRHQPVRSSKCCILSQVDFFYSEPRRAAVAIILRIVPSPQYAARPSTYQPTLTEFFELDWVKSTGSRAEVLFLHREKGESTETLRSGKEAHVAFPGGRMEEGDEGGLYTCEYLIHSLFEQLN